MTENLAVQGVSGKSYRYQPTPKKTGEGDTIARAEQTIGVDAQTLYDLWVQLARRPEWQEMVMAVQPLTELKSHWVLGDPDAGQDSHRTEFEAEIVQAMPGVSFEWHSVSQDVKVTERVTFTSAPGDRGTRVSLLQTYRLPGGSVGDVLAAVVKRSPSQLAIENLRHFKQLAETGEIARVERDVHGPRGISGGIKKWFYGETNPAPKDVPQA